MLKHGWAKIGKTDKQSIITAYQELVPSQSEARAFFGGGLAADNASDAIINYLNTK